MSTWTTGGLYLSSDAYADGSPLDAGVFLALIIAAILVLRQRRISWANIAHSNRYLGYFFLYCLISLLWSDFPFISFKRWIKDFGNILMILVIVTDKSPADALELYSRDSRI